MTWTPWRRPQPPTDRQAADEEARFHIERRTAEFIARGMSRHEAARLARARFGDLREF
jgi:hypothetical protein